MKKYKIISLLLIVFFLTSCDNTSYSNIIVGVWKNADNLYTKEESFYFYDDNTFIVKMCNHDVNEKNCDNGFAFWSGTYKISGKKIILKYTNSNVLINGDSFKRPSEKMLFIDEYKFCELGANNECTSLEYNRMLSSKVEKFDITKKTVEDSVNNPLSFETKNKVLNYFEKVILELNVNATKLLNNKEDSIDFKYKTYYSDDTHYDFIYTTKNNDNIKFEIDIKNDIPVLTYLRYRDGKKNIISSAIRNVLPRNSYFNYSKSDIDEMSECFNSYSMKSCGKITAQDNGISLYKLNVEIKE